MGVDGVAGDVLCHPLHNPRRPPFMPQASTHLWATIPEIMAESLDVHHFLIRKLIQKYKMYEVKTIGDSFMCVCMQPSTAVKFAIGLQHAFQHFDWGSDAINEVATPCRAGGGGGGHVGWDMHHLRGHTPSGSRRLLSGTPGSDCLV